MNLDQMTDNILQYIKLNYKPAKYVRKIMQEHLDEHYNDLINYIKDHSVYLFKSSLYIKNNVHREDVLSAAQLAAYEAIKSGAILSEAILIGKKAANKRCYVLRKEIGDIYDR